MLPDRYSSELPKAVLARRLHLKMDQAELANKADIATVTVKRIEAEEGRAPLVPSQVTWDNLNRVLGFVEAAAIEQGRTTPIPSPPASPYKTIWQPTRPWPKNTVLMPAQPRH